MPTELLDLVRSLRIVFFFASVGVDPLAAAEAAPPFKTSTREVRGFLILVDGGAESDARVEVSVELESRGRERTI